MAFPCTSCGLCCKNIEHVLPNSAIIAERTGNEEIIFPYTHNNGVCEKHIDNKCSVYENRPLICNVDKMAEILNYDTKTFYKLNSLICNDLIDKAELNQEFKIKLH